MYKKNISSLCKNILAIVLLSHSCISMATEADGDGIVIRPSLQEDIYNITVPNDASVIWGDRQQYKTEIKGCGDSYSSFISYPLHFTAIYKGAQGPLLADDFIKVNEYVAVKTIVYISKNEYKWVAPFYNQQSPYTNYSCGTLQRGMDTGKQGEIQIKFLKPVMGGLNTEVKIEVFGRHRYSKVDTSEGNQLAKATIRINIPPAYSGTCTVNDGNVLDVYLGEMSISEIKKGKVKPFDLKFECKGGEFDKNTDVPIKVKFVGNGDFAANPNYFATNKTNLGIKLTETNPLQQDIENKKYFNVTIPRTVKYTVINMTVQPVIAGGEVSEGVFEATGTIFAEYL